MAKKKETEVNNLSGVKTVDEALAAIQKVHGKTSVQRLSDKPIVTDVDVISTGSIWVDDALGINGLPRGRIVEVFGPEGGGKTTLALHIISEAQKNGGMALFIDAEHALDVNLAKKVGVDPALFVVCQPDSGEQALDILEMSASSGQFAVIVIDSVSALSPQAELNGEMGDSHMGLLARLMGQALRKTKGIISQTNTLCIFINQIRMKIGVVFGNPETTSGGNALKFFSSVRLDIRRIGALKHKEKVIGNRVRVKIVKNKLAPPYRQIETDLIFGKGFNRSGEVLAAAHELDVVERKGSRYNYKGTEIANGKFAACEYLDAHPDLLEEILVDVKLERATDED